MQLTRQFRWMAAIALCGLGGATVVGCSGEAQIGGRIEAPPPPPPADRDGDGIPDEADKCPDAKEDGLPPDPKDGCPNLDADGDGIPIPQDKCPNEPETVNQFEDEDGCPDKKPLVQIVGQEVKINQKIQFAKASSKIEESSNAVLDAVAETLKTHPELQLIEVGGHASKEGDANYNRTLTQQRVESVVKALIGRGVPKERLMPQGYGFYCPLDEGTSEESLEKNRRVEFKILLRDGKPTDIVRGCEGASKAGITPKALPKAAPTAVTPPAAATPPAAKK